VTVGAADLPTTVLQGGRRKAYRPLSEADRAAAFEAGVAAYEAGRFFEAHEHLEPAWMGTPDPAERDFHQGLIKLAAAYVHAVRGNPLGIVKNLRGARDRLAGAIAGGADSRGVDLPSLLHDVDVRLERLARSPDVVDLDPPPLQRRDR
jgi:predicted metal-dependent hydrolase